MGSTKSKHSSEVTKTYLSAMLKRHKFSEVFTATEDFEKTFEGMDDYIEYYTPGAWYEHGRICFRLKSDPTRMGSMELLVGSTPDLKDETKMITAWFVRGKLISEWRPDSENPVKTSNCSWKFRHALRCIINASKEFPAYNISSANCNDFKKKLVRDLKNGVDIAALDDNKLSPNLSTLEYCHSYGIRYVVIPTPKDE